MCWWRGQVQWNRWMHDGQQVSLGSECTLTSWLNLEPHAHCWIIHNSGVLLNAQLTVFWHLWRTHWHKFICQTCCNDVESASRRPTKSCQTSPPYSSRTVQHIPQLHPVVADYAGSQSSGTIRVIDLLSVSAATATRNNIFFSIINRQSVWAFFSLAGLHFHRSMV